MTDENKIKRIKSLLDSKFGTEDKRIDISGDEMYDLLVEIDEAVKE